MWRGCYLHAMKERVLTPHLQGGGEGGLDNGERGREELGEDGVLAEEVRAEQVLRRGCVHQQLVHAAEQHLRQRQAERWNAPWFGGDAQATPEGGGVADRNLVLRGQGCRGFSFGAQSKA